MKLSILACLLLPVFPVFCQTTLLNSDFETTVKGNPTGWTSFGSGDYILAVDSTLVKSGKNSVSIAFSGKETGFKAWSFTIPENYPGTKITLTGYIKTENVTEGWAGLWLRIDPDVAFNNMKKNGIKGTTDWTKYSITLKMDPKNTRQIVFGGLLAGKGKMWLDDLQITIDGKELKEIISLKKPLLPAEKDHAFDNGSEITSISTDHTADLKQLGLIWGFLKYHHPAIAKGNHNWDYELFRILPQVMRAENTKTRDEILTKWVAGLGEYTPGKASKHKPSDIKTAPDLAWITTSGFSEELTALLLQVLHAKRPGKHFYISLDGIGRPDFLNENAYVSMPYPDAGFRLLALYRYWNAIQYYFPYKNLIEEDWKQVLEAFIPKVTDAKNETEYALTMLELIGHVHDTHANIYGSPVLSAYFGNNYAPIELTFLENTAVVTGYLNEQKGTETGLVNGDIVTHINNKPVETIVKEQLIHAPASNYTTQLREIAMYLMRSNDSVIRVDYIRNGKTATNTLKTYSPGEMNPYGKYKVKDTCFRMIQPQIACINNGSLKESDLAGIWDHFKDTKGLIIDCRNYPYDFPLYRLSSYLMPDRTPYASFTEGSLQQPGLFTFTGALKAGKKRKDYYKGKVIILVNENSQSSAEFHAMAYRVNPNSIVIGSTTAGADGNVTGFSLPGGLKTLFSGIGVYYPNHGETQRIGIVPDIEVKPTIKGVSEGRDELMEKAIEVINGK